MPQVIETTSDGKQTTTKWWTSQVTLQNVIIIIGGLVSMVLFWKDSKTNWDKTKSLETVVTTKADKAETDAKIRATDDKVNRQYENNNKIMDRIISIEKELEYQRGVHDAQEKADSKKQQ
jgi:hypothetical protein